MRGGGCSTRRDPTTPPDAPTYAAFWHRYLRAHARPATRRLHYAGSLLALAAILAAVITQHWWWLVAAPATGYAFAWFSHVFLEGNRPETFGHPLWSLASDFRMLALWVGGRLEGHLEAARGERDGMPPRSGAAGR
jgi:hypothetical protein